MKANDCIFFQLAKISQLGARTWGQKVSDLNITAVQAMVLRFLYDKDGVTSMNLGKKTELDSSTVTGILDRLESACLITRKNNPNDRRSILIYLTEKGKVTGGEVAKRMEEANKDFFKTVNKQEEKELRRIINAIRNQYAK
ncbi:MAG: MarR family transcriptional regulator [Smithellaceae bacterium]|jgi:DNA-binding MarR family transcriptional regulator